MGVVNTVLPVFVIIALGAVLRRFGFISDDFAGGLTHLVYWVALPALLFYKMAVAQFAFAQAGKTYLIVLCGMAGCIIVSYIAAIFMKLPATSVASFVQGAFRGNLAYIGLPIVLYCNTFSENQGCEQVATIAVLVLGMTVPVYNFVAVVVLLASKHKLNSNTWRRVLIKTVRNPLVISSVVGIFYSATVGSLPPFADRTFAALAQMALPMALLSIGASLAGSLHPGRALTATVSSLIKVAVAPLIGMLVLMLLEVSFAEKLIAMIFLACPTAVSSHVYSQQLKTDEQLSASIVLLSTLFSIVSLSLMVYLV